MSWQIDYVSEAKRHVHPVIVAFDNLFNCIRWNITHVNTTGRQRADAFAIKTFKVR